MVAVLCGAPPPKLRDEVAAVLRRVEREPVRVRAFDAEMSLDLEVRLEPEELERLTGTWSSQDGLELRTDIAGGLLRLSFPNGSFVVAATSPTRFRKRTGEPGTLTFRLEKGRAVAVSVEDPEGSFELTRRE